MLETEEDWKIDMIRSPSTAVLLYYLNSGMFRFDQYKQFDAQASRSISTLGSDDAQNSGHDDLSSPNANFFCQNTQRPYADVHNMTELEVDKMKREIAGEALSPDEARELMKDWFIRHSYTEGSLFACGACGRRLMERDELPAVKYERLFLDLESSRILEYNDDDSLWLKTIKAEGPVRVPTGPDPQQVKYVMPWKLVSYFETDDGKMYHLHPELIQREDDGRLFTRLCPCCWSNVEAGKIPPNSIASGVDFGDSRRLGMEPLWLHEQLILSRVRLYMANVKLMSNDTGQATFATKHRLRGHAVLFKHDAPVVADEMQRQTPVLTDPEYLRTLMQLYFVDENGRSDILMHNLIQTSNLLARPWVIYQYLRILKCVNEMYTAIQIPSYTDLTSAVHTANESIVRDTVVVDDKESIAFEAQLGSDVAHAQTDERGPHNKPQDISETGDEPTPLTDDSKPLPLRTSCMIKKPELMLTEDEDGGEQACLGALAQLVHAGNDERVTAAPTKVCYSDIELEDMDNIDASQGGDRVTLNTSRREGTPMNEIEAKDTLLVMAFPDVFLLGKAYGKCGGKMTSTERQHMLSQFTLAPASNRLLIGYLFDSMQRAHVNFRVDAYVKDNPESVQAMTDLFIDPEMQSQLRYAAENPASKEAKKFMDKYFKHISFAGRAVPYGAVSARGFKSKAMALCRRHGMPSGFLTFSFADPDNPRSFRMSFSSVSNDRFPAVFGSDGDGHFGEDGVEFMNKLRDGSSVMSSGSVEAPCLSRSARAHAAITNPVVYVQESKNLFHDVCAILLGVVPEGFYDKTEGMTLRRSRYFMDHKGVLGHGQCILAVVEDHAKGTIHYHLLFFGGISPAALQRLSGMDELCSELSRVLDTMFAGSIAQEIHTQVIVEKTLSTFHNVGLRRADIYNIPREPLLLRGRWREEIAVSGTAGGTLDPEEAAAAPETCPTCYMTAAEIQAAKQNWHEHMATCRKGLMGHTGCRLNMPAATREVTWPVLLSLPEKDDPVVDTNAEKTKNKPSFSVQDPLPSGYVPDLPADGGVLCRKLSKQVCVWEIARPTITPNPPSVAHEFLMAVQFEKNIVADTDHMECRSAVESHLRELVKSVHGLGPGTRFWNWISTCKHSQLALVYKELMDRLPRANGYVSTYNHIASYCTGSHVNFQLLGSDDQARGAIFYICPYMGKEKVPLEQCITILRQAMKHVNKYKSSAEDSGTDFRRSVHLLERCLNRMNLMMELSDYQMSAALVQLPSVICSDKFAYWTPKSCQEYRRSLANDGRSTESLCIGKVHYIIVQNAETGEKERKAIPRAALYPNRGENLRYLNRYEYCALIQFCPINGGSRSGEEGLRGGRFPFSSSLSISSSHHQSLFGKQRTPVILGQEPKPPGPRPEPTDSETAHERWRKAADNYADHILTIFRAEEECYDESMPNPYKYNWESLVDWVASCQQSTSILSKFRLFSASRHVNSFSTLFDVKRMLMDYRGRSRDMWTDSDSRRRWDDEDGALRNCRKDNDSKFLDDLAFRANNAVLPETTTKSLDRVTHWSLLLTTQFMNVSHRRTKRKILMEAPGSCRSLVYPLLECSVDADDFEEQFLPLQWQSSEVENATIEQQQQSSKEGRNAGTRHDIQHVIHRLRNGARPEEALNRKQAAVFDLYVDHLVNGGKPPPPVLLVHGQGGSGKTEAILRLCELVPFLGKTIFKTAFNNINAVAFDGQTTASAVDLHARKDMTKLNEPNTDTLMELRKSLETAALIVIDEVSTQAPYHLAKLSYACQLITGKTEVFGGLPAVLVGDFGQLGPVKAGDPIPKAVIDLIMSELPRTLETNHQIPRRVGAGIKFRPTFTEEMEAKLKPDHPYAKGGEILRSACFVEMTQQMRAPDPVQAALVGRMYEGGTISSDDLKQYDLLSEADFNGSEGDWSNASIIVTTNRERLSLIHHQAINFAIANNTVVLRWEMEISEWEQMPSDEFIPQVKKDPCFYQYFVSGAPAYLNSTINKDLRLVNSTPVTLESIMMEDEISQRSVLEMVAAASPGDVITLEDTPVFVNVRVQTKKFSAAVKKMYKKHFRPISSSETETVFVLPIRVGNSLGSSYTVPVPGIAGRYLASRLSVKPPFRFETAFAITVHKAQGQTLPRVILALSKGRGQRGFSYSHLYVALSRVAERSDIRLLLVGTIEEMKWRSVTYVEGLTADKHTISFLAGFRGRSRHTDIRRATFDPRPALKKYSTFE